MAQAVVGLGNPGDEYASTRHNVGQRVVDRMARALHRRFTRYDSTLLACSEWGGETLYLVKPQAFMNVTGPPLVRLGQGLSLEVADYVLVYDDIDLPVGTVRVRMRGSHGGHNGVRSVVEALGSSDLRRVKIGIGRPADKADVAAWVLTPFSTDEGPVIERACAEAAERVLGLVASRPR